MTAKLRNGIEEPFCQWIREEKRLDSVRDGITVNNLDMLIHRYKTERDGIGDRTIQAMMFVEVKTHMACPTPAQRETLCMLDQVLRNRRTTPTSKRPGRHAVDHSPLAQVYSVMWSKPVKLKLFGGHLLTLSMSRPDEDQCHIYWSGGRIGRSTEISLGMLIDLLRFDLDPDTLRVNDGWRRHHKPGNQLQLLVNRPAT